MGNAAFIIISYIEIILSDQTDEVTSKPRFQTEIVFFFTFDEGDNNYQIANEIIVLHMSLFSSASLTGGKDSPGFL